MDLLSGWSQVRVLYGGPFYYEINMFDLLQRLKNVRDGVFIKKKIHVLDESRSERQIRMRKEQYRQWHNSIKAQGVGYGYDYRSMKRHKPKKAFFG